MATTMKARTTSMTIGGMAPLTRETCVYHAWNGKLARRLLGEKDAARLKRVFDATDWCDPASVDRYRLRLELLDAGLSMTDIDNSAGFLIRFERARELVGRALVASGGDRERLRRALDRHMQVKRIIRMAARRRAEKQHETTGAGR